MSRRALKILNGIEVQPEHLTLEFSYAGKTTYLGKFNPRHYPRLLDRVPRAALFGELYDQLEEFGRYPESTMRRIARMSKDEFYSYLSDREVETEPA